MDATASALRQELGYTPSHSKTLETAKNILTDIMQFRRVSGPRTCVAASCKMCVAPHVPQIILAIEQGIPITFVLPAFPGKSPNSAKVLGALPDMAERCALEFLQHLCDRVKKYYSPGARIILCSDGRVFSDVVGLRDEDVTNYQKELSKMIVSLGLTSISTFNLDGLYENLSFDGMRDRLIEQHGEPLEALKEAVHRGKVQDPPVDAKEVHRLYCGITRFLLEDALLPGQKQSRSSLQKECRIRAYSVIQRSKAWGELIETKFPEAVRLSIHPQSCGAKKLGVRLSDLSFKSGLSSGQGPDNWLTPWHGVAVHVNGRFMLFKRAQAEALGAHLITRFGRPSHYVLTNNKDLTFLDGERDRPDSEGACEYGA